MAHLVEIAVRQLQSGRAAKVQRLASTDLRVEALVASLDERAELVDRKEVLDAIAEVLGDVPRVVGEGLGGVLRLPAAVFVLECLRQIPVIERGERFDAGG